MEAVKTSAATARNSVRFKAPRPRQHYAHLHKGKITAEPSPRRPPEERIYAPVPILNFEVDHRELTAQPISTASAMNHHNWAQHQHRFRKLKQLQNATSTKTSKKKDLHPTNKDISANAPKAKTATIHMPQRPPRDYNDSVLISSSDGEQISGWWDLMMIKWDKLCIQFYI